MRRQHAGPWHNLARGGQQMVQPQPCSEEGDGSPRDSPRQQSGFAKALPVSPAMRERDALDSLLPCRMRTFSWPRTFHGIFGSPRHSSRAS